MVVSRKKGTPIKTPTYHTSYSWDPPKKNPVICGTPLMDRILYDPKYTILSKHRGLWCIVPYTILSLALLFGRMGSGRKLFIDIVVGCLLYS